MRCQYFFMHEVAGKGGSAPLEKPRYAVWMPARVEHVLAAVTGQPRQVINVMLRVGKNSLNFRLQLRRNAFIGINRKHPITVCKRECAIFLNTETLPIEALAYCGARGYGHVRRAIGATRIKHNNLVSKSHRREAGSDVVRFVFRNHND